MVVMGSMWGLQFSMLKFAALSGLGEINLLMVTLVLLALVFSGYVILKGESLRYSREWVLFLFVIAFLGYVAPLGVTLFVAPHITVGALSMIACLAPVVTILLALLYRSEPVSRARKIALLLGLISVMLILWPELQLPELGSTGWMLAALGIPLAYGIEPILVDTRWPRGMTSSQLVAGEAIAAVIIILPLFLMQDDPIHFDISRSTAAWPLVVFVLAGIVETLLYFQLIKTTGGVFVSFGTFVSLIAGVTWGMLLFSERHGIYVWLAILFLLGALYLACKGLRASEAAQKRNS
ncbi:MAG: DMT family transporter [bacterium]